MDNSELLMAIRNPDIFAICVVCFSASSLSWHDATNKAAKFIIDYCLSSKIGNIVFGWNKGQSQNMEMGRKNNQNFATIPTGKLKERLKQMCTQWGILFTETEESYTSKSSFFDSPDDGSINSSCYSL